MSLLDEIKKIPAHRLFYLLVDGHLIAKENGWQAYERREPGCMRDFFNALAYATKDLDKKEVTVTFLQTLHALASYSAMENKVGRPGEFYYDAMGGLFQGADHRIQLPKTNITARGILQFLAFQDAHAYQYTGGIISKNVLLSFETVDKLAGDAKCTREAYVEQFLAEAGETITIQPITPNDMEDRVRRLISELNEKVMMAAVEDKERVIVEHIQLLEQLHPFFDVNNRTFINLLLFRLSLQHDLSPAILMDYNIFDGHSVDEILVKLQEGREHFAQMIKGGPLFNYDADTMLEDDKLKLVEFTKSFTQGLSPKLQRDIHQLEAQHDIKACVSSCCNKSRDIVMGDFFKTINAEVMATHKLIFDKIKPIFESEQSKDSKLGDLARLIEETKGKEQECYKFIQKTMTTSGEEAISDQDTLYLFHEYIAEAIPIKAQNLVANVAGLFSTLVRELRECEFLSCREFLKTYPMQSALDDYCQEDGLETAPLKEQLSQLYLDMKTSIEVIEEQYEAQRADQPRLGFFPLAQAGADADLSDAQGLKVSP